MTAWTGKWVKEGKTYIPGCLPHRSYVPRKPEPIGCERKTTVDATSYIMVSSEAEEGKGLMKEKEYRDKYTHTTATSLRLVKPWFGTGQSCMYVAYVCMSCIYVVYVCMSCMYM